MLVVLRIYLAIVFLGVVRKFYRKLTIYRREKVYKKIKKTLDK